jgi:hypothetical protein
MCKVALEIDKQFGVICSVKCTNEQALEGLGG